ncbi:3D-(3,5/4)-trihydroxycyclohexane-1,2-dione acylhydrolase (decyclizing) [Sphaerisporangium siamense]|uniref:3D-(3,5/4)-trihydroxycyclohexane-1,2-dione acylhydrolase (Decyclizing) n=1 Tax=Sphaerisporangium siamense TaxID=795645 RepID=A0A7W7D5X8_9ACTN|nr:3D-(3,5/4)-trihydroxycyclohexane-1,2-dione acylhydrolase (decyclizing) [Sphaerisporangium siamense]MBB4700862.1 3D-(3,5/4)-trihydroxycyclohexane-1,2-dione acylhydrolase (decyclizing) [Sphaerisporangium siamense]GII85993.1 3D-(3,5/4)-trihydroxycyclohexane-1,2-dione acylhydrolase (decyclizing) [Sphaerisporangium siamense]
MNTIRLTVAQALVRFLAQQWSERDGIEQRLIAGCFGIFGHGNVAGVGQALAESGAGLGDPLPYYLARNEQAMVHTAVGYARTLNRLSTFACTTSIGPGATNMVTGAALATINRIPVLLLPGDVFATRAAGAVLQELEDPRSYDVTVNDCLRPVSRFFDRINRPEQLPSALMAAMRVLTDPAETGAVTLALPQDVQAEAYDWPVELFGRRLWHVARPIPDAASVERAAEVIRSSRRPLIVAGGGVVYGEAWRELTAFAEEHGVPVGETQAGKGVLPHDHPCALGAIGHTGTAAANAVAREADLVIGVGTRYTDFTTASRTLFGDARFVNVNVAAFDAAKHAGVMLVGDARETLALLDLAGWRADPSWTTRAAGLGRAWRSAVSALQAGESLTQPVMLGVLNEVAGTDGVVVNAAGSMPGDLHKLWRASGPEGYHVEYGYSCMGYEIAGGLGVKLAAPEREVFVLVGDGSYLMMAQEIVTAVQEGVKLVIVIVDNHGFASIGGLSESVGARRLGTSYRMRSSSGRLDGPYLPVDLAANAATLGADVLRATDPASFRDALLKAREARTTTVVHVETVPGSAPETTAWWDVPVAEVATDPGPRAGYEEAKRAQRPYL